MADPTIQMDVENTDAYDGFDPVKAFLENLGHGEEQSRPAKTRKRDEPEADEDRQEPEDREQDEPEADEADEGQDDADKDDEADKDEGADDEAEKDRKVVSDDDEVEIVVDGVAQKASIKDLKRLYGQEAVLTRKAQEAAAVRKAADEQAQVYQTGLDRMRTEAEARWREYEGVDYLAARDRLSPEAFERLREDASKAYQSFKFFDEELKATAEKVQTAHAERMKAAAAHCVKALTSDVREDGTPNPHKVEGWSDALYDDIRKFAVTEVGLEQSVVNSIVDPGAIKIMWMAMQFAKAQKAAKATARPKPAVPAPKKALTSKTAPDRTDSATRRQTYALSRLRSEGSVDAGAAAFLAQWGVDGSDD